MKHGLTAYFNWERQNLILYQLCTIKAPQGHGPASVNFTYLCFSLSEKTKIHPE
jgi:hypothetical protein